MRLIDADALNDMINRSYPMTDRIDVHNGYAICQEMIKQLPTIEERKRGEWINDKGLYRCSACNELWVGWWAVIVPIERMNKEMRFCPNCGAEMGGEKHESSMLLRNTECI